LSCQQGNETDTQEKTKEMNGKMGLLDDLARLFKKEEFPVNLQSPTAIISIFC
jgi:hypothetical protein